MTVMAMRRIKGPMPRRNQLSDRPIRPSTPSTTKRGWRRLCLKALVRFKPDPTRSFAVARSRAARARQNDAQVELVSAGAKALATFLRSFSGVKGLAT